MADVKEPVSSQPQVCVPSMKERPYVSVSCHVLCTPQGIAPMSAGGNRNAKNCPAGPDGKREWSFRLYDCFDRFDLCT
jgi:hypothetical protein